MPEHGDNYKQHQPKNGEPGGKLDPAVCGHHCGVQKIGLAHSRTGHCDCPECHSGDLALNEVPSVFTSGPGLGVDPRRIT